MSAKSADPRRWWSIAQAIVWIVSRDELAADDAAGIRFESELPPLKLIPRAPPDGGPPIPLEEAPDELRRAVQRGDISVYGERRGSVHADECMRQWPGSTASAPKQASQQEQPHHSVLPEAPAPGRPALRKIGDREASQTACCRADLLLLFPDGNVPGSYREIGAHIEKKTFRRYSKDVIRTALDRKKP
jgi:hypothetical protein